MGPVNAPDGDDQDLRAYENLADVGRSGSDWVRLWVRWDQVQPLPPTSVGWDAIDTAANPGLAYLRALDAQIALARAQRPALGVVLTSWLFPQWSNGTAAIAAGSAADLAFAPQDRLTRGQEDAGDPDGRRQPLNYRVPPLEQLAPTGHWGRWIRFLIQRYAHLGEGMVLEVMNEPNLQWWPQQGPSPGADPFAPGPPLAPASAARMMATAQVISAGLGAPIGIAGPGTADYPAIDPVRGDTRRFTGYASFTAATLDALDALGFEAGPEFVWTQHNYVDTLLGLGGTPATQNRAADTRAALAGRWTGRRRDGGPELWLTEGGVDLRARRVAGDLAVQARLLGVNLELMADRTGAGAGIGMVTNYLNYSEQHYDSGLRAPLDLGGARRPAADVWRSG